MVLLKKHINTMTPNDILYTHRSVPCSATSREACSWNSWERVQRPTTRHVQSERDLGTFTPQTGCRHQILFSELRKLYRSRGRKAVGAIADGGRKESKLLDPTGLAQEWAHRHGGGDRLGPGWEREEVLFTLPPRHLYSTVAHGTKSDPKLWVWN